MKDLTGQAFGRLKVLNLSHIDGQAYWLCQCQCGNQKAIASYSLRKGLSKSCGCLVKDFPPSKGKTWKWREGVGHTSQGRKRISKAMKRSWQIGSHALSINGMLGKIGEFHPAWKSENHTPTFLAEKEYCEFLSNFQDISICLRCGNKKPKRNVHHIDEDHSNFLISNLEPLCVPCHGGYHYESRKLIFLTIGKSFTFDAAHFLPGYKGKCANLHGHQWKLNVCIKKRVDKKTGMVLDFGILKEAVDKTVIEVLDHHCVNNVIVNPTAENILVWVWEQLMFEALLKGIDSISLWETPTSEAVLTKYDMLSIFSSNIEDYLLKYRKITK